MEYFWRKAVLVGLVGLTFVGSTLAQTSQKVYRIGFLGLASASSQSSGVSAFRDALRELGYVEGRSLIIEFRWAEGRHEQLQALADELVRMKVDLIVAYPSPAIRAAQAATSTIPIVFPTTGDPIGSGFALSLAHPGKNLTGLSNNNSDLSAKGLELMMALRPGLSRVAVLGNPVSSTYAGIVASIRNAARQLAIHVVTVDARTPAEIGHGFEELATARIEGLIIAMDGLMASQMGEIAQLALHNRLPTVTQHPGYAEKGGLVGYGVDRGSLFRRAAIYVDKILKGSKPADLPIEQPTKFELAINLKTAKTLGVSLPQSMLIQADRVIK